LLKGEIRQFGDKYEKFHNKKQIFRRLFLFFAKFFLLLAFYCPKKRIKKKRISGFEHDLIGQTKSANSLIRD
jgi:hypothetical protein